MSKLLSTIIVIIAGFSGVSFASEGAAHAVDFTRSSVGIASIIIFVIAYLLVVTEELTPGLFASTLAYLA